VIKLNPTESKTLQLIEQWQREYRNSPNVAEIKRHIQRERSTVYTTLKSLHDKGYIDLIRIGHRFIIFPLYWE
jgi:predicted transcriptional regulator